MENKSSFGMASQWREEVEKKTFTFFFYFSLSPCSIYCMVSNSMYDEIGGLSSSLALKWLQTLIWIAHSFSVYVVCEYFFFLFCLRDNTGFHFIYIIGQLCTMYSKKKKKKDIDGKISAYCEQKEYRQESIALGWKEEKKVHIRMIRTSDGCWSFHHAIHHIDSLCIALVLQIQMRKKQL